MKAVLTKSLPCTNTLPARIKAYDCDGKSIVLSREMAQLGAGSALHFEGNERDDTPEYRAHCFTAWEFITQRGWLAPAEDQDYQLIGGGIEGGFAWVLIYDPQGR